MFVLGYISQTMEHPLRITYKDSEFSFKLIKNSPITKKTTEFQIKLDDEVITIAKTGNNWIQKDNTINLKPELINAIGHSLSLRFRLQ